MTIKYSDGVEIESKILQILHKQTNLSSNTPIAIDQYDQWPIRYHLCPERANLLRHLSFTGLDVLELGAGMGAVSRYIAENANSLTVIEGTQARFDALSERLRDLKNWTGFVGNIQNQSNNLSKKFDVVAVIGVLEYAELFLCSDNNEEPFSHFIRIASSHLKPGGVLIIAIENKLGLKYWSGAAEDHTGRMFDGITGYPRTKSPKTFSRNELLSKLKAAGLQTIEEFYPFPDYKLPTTVLSKKCIDLFPDISAEMITRESSVNYGQQRFLLFPEPLAAMQLSQAGLLGDFSNSFLFLACSNSPSQIQEKLLKSTRVHNAVAWHYSQARKHPTKTIFHFDEAKIPNLVVTKSESFNTEEIVTKRTYFNSNLKIVWQEPEKAHVSRNKKLRNLLLQNIYFEEWKPFVNELRSFIAWSFEKWKTTPPLKLDGSAIDAVFSNAALENSSYDLFDLEWISETPINKSWFIFRNVVNLTSFTNYFSSSAPFSSLNDLYETLCKDLDIPSDLESDISNEACLQNLIANSIDGELYKKTLLSIFNFQFSESPKLPRHPEIECARFPRLSFLENEYRRLNENMEIMTRTLNLPRHQLADSFYTFLGKHRFLKFFAGTTLKLVKLIKPDILQTPSK